MYHKCLIFLTPVIFVFFKKIFFGEIKIYKKKIIPPTKKKKKKNKDSRDKAKIDFASLLKNHQNNPSVVVGNFNMTKQQLKILILEFLINGLL